MDEIQKQRKLLRSDFSAADFQSDQQKGVPCPPPEKPAPEGAARVELGDVDPAVVTHNDLLACLQKRRSRRKFTADPLTREQLGFLLWATQGVKRILGDGQVVFRTVPSAGARHPFETYLLVRNVEGIDPGIWRYVGSSHDLVLVKPLDGLDEKIASALLGQAFILQAPVTLVWAALPYRTEWRYHTLAHKPILIDAGHVAQNLYLAAEAIGCGTCAIAAYDQRAVDALLGLDGKDEFVVYLAPVGRV